MGRYSKGRLSRQEREKMLKDVGQSKRDEIDNEFRRKEKQPVRKLGARAIFLQKYKETGDFEKSKQELINKGFEPESFKNSKLNKTSDDTFKEWIDEGR